ncbi:MAG TPA: polysaccharide deacetylase family protein [Candidatus Saccharimonadales bacterium]|nr:polysaccharide deacetylase family protein [Candidatus Saccharimonadales bacterium]
MTVKKYKKGDAKWYPDAIKVSPNASFVFSDWYKSNTKSGVDLMVTTASDTSKYIHLGDLPASAGWKQAKFVFVTPPATRQVTIYHYIKSNGKLTTDDYSLTSSGSITSPKPTGFNRPLISITFDDGWANQYKNAFPLLSKYGLQATFYIISGEVDDQPDYMSSTQVKNLYTAGNEIGSHTISHPDLTTLSKSAISREMSGSQTYLQNLIGVPVRDFAYPYGAYNTNTASIGKQFYQSQRTVNRGFNTKDNLDLTALKIYEVDNDISQTQVKAWIDSAIKQKAWLILVYHEIAKTPVVPSDELYSTTPSDFEAELSYIKNSGASAVTVRQAINEVLAQL